MKVYASPVPAPEWAEYEVDGMFSHAKYNEVNAAYYAKVAEQLKADGYHHKLTGKIVRFPVADGAAEYMIANGTALIHLPLGDAWQIPTAHARGLRISDLTAELARAEAVRKLFAEKEAKS